MFGSYLEAAEILKNLAEEYGPETPEFHGLWAGIRKLIEAWEDETRAFENAYKGWEGTIVEDV